MTEQMFNEITQWQNETFPDSTEMSRVKHLIQEIKELEFDVDNDSDGKKYEYADCFFLLFGAAKKAGMSYRDICRVIKEKFEINKKRSWGKADENGVVNHIKINQ